MDIPGFIKNTLLLSLLLVISIATFAQQPVVTPAQKAQIQTQWMQNNLGITDNQSKKIYSIVLHFAQMDEAEGSDRNADSRTKDADIRAILTAGQYHNYHAHLQDMYKQEAQASQQQPLQNSK